MKKPKNPYAVTLTPEQRTELQLWAVRELQAAIDAKGSTDQEVDYWHQLYEQARTRGRNTPWPDAADLTSYLAAEKADAITARMMKTIFVDPVYSVEGWGTSTERAPFVEEFHQWKVEEERLQNVLDRLIQIALIEPRGLLEVYEGSEYRTVRKQINAAVQTDPMTGGVIYGEDGQPQLQVGADGKFVEAQDPMQEQLAVTVVDDPQPVRCGPCYRIIPYRDSVIFPGHARDQQDIWGFGKRFWKRLPDIQRQSMGDRPLYDPEVVAQLTNTGNKEPDPAMQRSGMSVAPQQEITAEKELWELSVLVDLDALMAGKGVGTVKPELRGARWYVLTVSLDQNLLLRVQHDDMETCRYLPVILFPRPDRATEGFSLIGHKLCTIIEEHTAWRNMAADHGSLLNQRPIKRLQGALWDPLEQPFGPKAVIDVRDMREVEEFQMSQIGMNEAFEHIQMLERNAERVVGVNDIASGSVLQQDKTLGEIQMATQASEIRMDLISRRFNEFMEDLFQIRHVIWKRALAEKPDGVDVPQTLLAGLEGRGVAVDQYLPDKKITAALLEGAFRGKPRGSVESADKNRQRMEFTNALAMLPRLVQTFPMLLPMFQSPQAARAMARQFLYLWDIPNQQAFLGSPAQDLMQTQQLEAMPPMLPPMLGAGPGAAGPPGMPPPAGGAPNPLSALAQILAQHGPPPPGLVPGPSQPQ